MLSEKNSNNFCKKITFSTKTTVNMRETLKIPSIVITIKKSTQKLFNKINRLQATISNESNGKQP